MILQQWLVTIVTLCCVAWLPWQAEGEVEFRYHNFRDLESFLFNVSQSFPHITSLYSIGQSVQGRDLWVLSLGDLPDQHVLLRPDVKYVANIHGNEVTGREVLIHLIDLFVNGYEKNSTITNIMKTTRIHILVSMNPDGFENATNNHQQGECSGIHGRYNKNNYDLNRNFPDYFDENPRERQPEAQAIMDWLQSQQFVLSANLHDGAMVVNYPYDNYKGAAYDPGIRYSMAKDDDVMRHLARSYASNHETMHLGKPCAGDRSGFKEGITNGADWYPVHGGMQDYNYIFHGCIEMTVEMSCCKYSAESELPRLWRENKNSLITYLQQAQIGVKGIVSNVKGEAVQGAEVEIVDRDHPTKTTPLGEYWRLLLPGNYKLNVRYKGYKMASHNVTVIAGQTAIQNFTLRKRRKNGKQNGRHSQNGRTNGQRNVSQNGHHGNSSHHGQNGHSGRQDSHGQHSQRRRPHNGRRLPPRGREHYPLRDGKSSEIFPEQSTHTITTTTSVFQVKASGYKPQSEHFEVREGQPTIVNVTLQKGQDLSAASQSDPSHLITCLLTFLSLNYLLRMH